jgi:cytochrome b561
MDQDHPPNFDAQAARCRASNAPLAERPHQIAFPLIQINLTRRGRTTLFAEDEAMKSNASEDYGPVAKALHWATAFLVIAAWLLGTFGDDLAEGPVRESGLLIHIWMGLTILVIAFVRIPWRIANPPPKILATEFGKWLVEWTDPVSRVMHYLLYALLVLVPLFGIAVQFARGHSLPLFGLAEIPSPWIADKAFAHSLKEVHEALANLLVILAAFHMTAALLHHIVFGDHTLRRMLPRSRRRAAGH